MKVVILAGGFGTRLEKDILREDVTSPFRKLLGVPKPLLPIGSKTLLERWMTVLKSTSIAETDVYVITNGVTHHLFEIWAATHPGVHLVCDHGTSNETRPGAVAAMPLAMEEFLLSDDVLLIAGDTLFPCDFSLKRFIGQFETYKKTEPNASLLVHVLCPETLVHKYGILEKNPENNRVVGFKEKPQPHETTSRYQCPCFYLINKSSLSLLRVFLAQTKDFELNARDSPGMFMSFLIQQTPVFAVPVSGRFDVGGLDTYKQCHQYFMDLDERCYKY